jgi:hypothetical protein
MDLSLSRSYSVVKELSGALVDPLNQLSLPTIDLPDLNPAIRADESGML